MFPSVVCMIEPYLCEGHLLHFMSFYNYSYNCNYKSYGAVSGSKIQGHLFGMMLRHNDTTLWPVSKALRHSYTTFSLHNLMFWLYSWAVRRNDVTFRLYLYDVSAAITAQCHNELPHYRHMR